MKKIIVFAAAIALSASAFAQSPLKGLMLGAGLSVDPISWNFSTEGINGLPITPAGFHVYAAYEYQLSTVSAISAGLRFQLVSENSYNKSLGDVSESLKNTMSFLDIPVKYVAHFGGFFISAGPTLTFNLAWDQKSTVTAFGQTETTTYKCFKEDKDTYNGIGVGLGAEIGYDWSHIRVSAGYDRGLIPGVKKDKANGRNYNINNIRIGIAYLF